MNRALLILPLALSLQGCVLEKLKDPSKPTPAQQAMVDAGMFGVMTEVSVTPAKVEAVASVAVASPVEAVTLAAVAEPTCHEVFRENRCSDGLSVEWFYGDAPEAPEPVVVAEVVPEPVPVVEPHKPVCQAVFRISYCDEAGNEVMI